MRWYWLLICSLLFGCSEGVSMSSQVRSTDYTLKFPNGDEYIIPNAYQVAVTDDCRIIAEVTRVNNSQGTGPDEINSSIRFSYLDENYVSIDNTGLISGVWRSPTFSPNNSKLVAIKEHGTTSEIYVFSFNNRAMTMQMMFAEHQGISRITWLDDVTIGIELFEDGKHKYFSLDAEVVEGRMYELPSRPHGFNDGPIKSVHNCKA